MAGSVSSNPALLAALQTFDRTNRELEVTQSRISTRLAVSRAADDPAAFDDAQASRSEIAGLRAARFGLNQATSLVDTSLAAGQTIADILTQLRTIATQASDPGLAQSQRDALTADFQSLIVNIDRIGGGAIFNRINLLDGSEPNGVRFPVDGTASSTLTIGSEDLRLGGPIIAISAATDISSAGAAQSALTQIDQSISATSNALGRLGAVSAQVTAHQDFLLRYADSLQKGVGNLVDADLGAESVRLTALQVQQQLTSQVVSIANRSPDAILSLFR